MTTDQCRAARELLGWSLQRLGVRSGLTGKTVHNFEAGTKVRPQTWAEIQATLTAAGVEFTNGDAPGVRLRRLSE